MPLSPYYDIVVYDRRSRKVVNVIRGYQYPKTVAQREARLANQESERIGSNLRYRVRRHKEEGGLVSRRVNKGGKSNPRRNPQWEVKRGSRQVVIWANTPKGPFESRLYVNHGETATTTSARHKTMAGAVSWANKTLDRHIGERGMSVTRRVNRSSNPRTTAKRTGDWRRDYKWDVVRGKDKIGEIEYKGLTYHGKAWMPSGSYAPVSGQRTLQQTQKRVTEVYDRAWKGVTQTVSGAGRSAPNPRSRSHSRSSNPRPGSRSFVDAKIRVRGGQVDILVPNPPQSTAAAFLKVMGRRRNGAGSMVESRNLRVGDVIQGETGANYKITGIDDWGPGRLRITFEEKGTKFRQSIVSPTNLKYFRVGLSGTGRRTA